MICKSCFDKSCFLGVFLIIATLSFASTLPCKRAIPIRDVVDFHNRLTKAGDKLVVVAFMAGWCRHSQDVAPKVEELAEKLKCSVVFVTVDVDECKGIATDYNVVHYPTFAFVRNFKKLEQYSGANYDKLQRTVKKYQ